MYKSNFIERKCSICGTGICMSDSTTYRYTIKKNNCKSFQCSYGCHMTALRCKNEKPSSIDAFNKQAIDNELTYGQLQAQETIAKIIKDKERTRRETKCISQMNREHSRNKTHS